ncbi:hypothetical protein [Paenibacillus sp. Y412MC10]|uniref:hypothetical protein n=1 Tax=Geobacillus sp. (strain Y412MC10) TaxID=481743 RepID=UPI0011AB7A0A|nr:hypothetical protein [Paenibacillus sp. Y412MC10]
MKGNFHVRCEAGEKVAGNQNLTYRYWIYVSKEKIRKEYGVKRVTKEIRQTVLSVLKGEVATYDMYHRGEIFGFVIEDKEGNQVDSCWGFYGSDPMKNGMKEHVAKEYADLLAEVA